MVESKRKKRKRFFSLSYEADQEPMYVEEAGNLFKISGILMQGKGTNLLILAPAADMEAMDQGWALGFVQPSLEEWCEILRRTDDPLVFEQDETGTIKAVHRKASYAISGAVQQQMWARDSFRCLYCGRAMGDAQLTVDHFIPLERGGKDDRDNYLSACRKCNKAKGNRPPEEFCEYKGLDFEGLQKYLEGKISLAFIAHLQK